MTFGKYAILGDSYSTYEGYIPEGYNSWYGEGKGKGNGVNSVEDTWWYPLCDLPDTELLFNCSYSGSTICNTGYEGAFCPDTSFVGRMRSYFSGEHGVPDTVFVFAGTNDTWANSPLGAPSAEAWDTYTDDELRFVLPAIHCMLDYLRAVLPHGRIVLLLNDWLSAPIAAALHTEGAAYGCDVIDLPDISRNAAHPTAEGMRQIRESILLFYRDKSN